MRGLASEKGAKAEETRARILDAALLVFRERGFAGATMREIAGAAQVAAGGAYYYFDGKDALVMAFYERAQERMQPSLERILSEGKSLEGRLKGIIAHKLEHFGPNRALLGALAAHMDPRDPVSPFSEETRGIRERDLDFFARAVAASKLKLPKGIAPYLPRLLWLYQMGVLLFWVYDESPGQKRTERVLDPTLKLVMSLIRLSELRVLRPLQKPIAELLRVVFEEEA